MKFPSTPQSARITEIFSSLQGEGTHVGERHLFIRFEECNIHCNYCDELHKKGKDWNLEQVLTEVESREKTEGPHRFISLTGGEPLIYLPFLKSLLPALKERKFSIYLETAGTLPSALTEIITYCDAISMDLKPPSVTREPSFVAAHRKFLEIAKMKDTHTKMILSKSIETGEFLELVQIIRDIAPDTELILQPISSDIEGHLDRDLMIQLEELHRLALSLIPNVRIIPRFHKIMKIR